VLLPGRDRAEPVPLRVMFNNSTGHTVSLNGYAMRLFFDLHAVGPDGKVVKREPLDGGAVGRVDQKTRPRQEDLLVCPSGQSYVIPQRLLAPDQAGPWRYRFTQPGRYRVRLVYNPTLADAKLQKLWADHFLPEVRAAGAENWMKRAWSAAVTGNEFTLDVVRGGGPEVDGLKLSLSASTLTSRLEMLPFRPVRLKITFTNVGKRPVALDPPAQLLKGLRLDLVGPDGAKTSSAVEGQARFARETLDAGRAVLQPGESWSSADDVRVTSFTGPGPHSFTAFYTREPAGGAGGWSGRLTSNGVRVDAVAPAQQ
jgi:hypothetical protein